MKCLAQKQILQKQPPLLGLAACELALLWALLSNLPSKQEGKASGREGVKGMAENNMATPRRSHVQGQWHEVI